MKKSGGFQTPATLTVAQLEQMQELWEGSELTASEIGNLVGVSKCVVIGRANRGHWRVRSKRGKGAPVNFEAEPSTLFERLDAIHARFDAVTVKP